MDQLLRELAGPGGSLAGGVAGGANPFRAFARRAALVITGLVHVSVLLLPRQHDEGGSGGGGAGSSSGSGAAAQAPAGKAGKGGGAGASGASSSRGGGGTGGGSGGDPAAELAAAGFPSDGSNLEEWQRVRSGSAAEARGCPARVAAARAETWLRAASRPSPRLLLLRGAHPADLPAQRAAAGPVRAGSNGHRRPGLDQLLPVHRVGRGRRGGGAAGERAAHPCSRAGGSRSGAGVPPLPPPLPPHAAAAARGAVRTAPAADTAAAACSPPPPQPPYPVSATAAYHAARVKQDALVTNDYAAQ